MSENARHAASVEHHMIDVREGLRLHVAIGGHGPPLVLLHGFTGSAETWAPLRAMLGMARTTVAVDLPGHGESDAPDDPARYALPRFADDLAHVLDVLRMPRVALLGYSLGGRAALHFALRHHRYLSALVLESASPGIGDERDRALRAAEDKALADAIEREGIDAFVARWEALPLWESQRQLSDDVRARLRAQRLANRQRGLANSLRAAGVAVEPALTEQLLAAVSIPVLLVAGALDAKYVAIGNALQVALPQAERAIVAGAGHTVHLERPEEFAALVTHFLARG